MRWISNLLLGLGAVFLFSQSAAADFRSCNTSGEKLWVAFGHLTDDRGWISEGWTELDNGYCFIHVRGALGNSFYYLYAEDEGIERVWEADRQQSGGVFCVGEDDFALVLDDYIENDLVDCGDDLFTVRFIEIDVGEFDDYTYTFTTEAGRAPAEEGALPAQDGKMKR
jgi:uncharacterized membrane protein